MQAATAATQINGTPRVSYQSVVAIPVPCLEVWRVDSALDGDLPKRATTAKKLFPDVLFAGVKPLHYLSKTSVPLLVPECSYLVSASFGLGKFRINLSPLRSIYDYNFFVKNTVIACFRPDWTKPAYPDAAAIYKALPIRTLRWPYPSPRTW